ncbi:hypothetical protein NSP_48820 [Nodularia spumigena CCY9414]|nr:hypothetical protein NSP_48820 [Nodularia spumigena CCY9414]EAW43746.1 hypothetical protein N9414_22283 [Nodularia spumigena CCY9414]
MRLTAIYLPTGTVPQQLETDLATLCFKSNLLHPWRLEVAATQTKPTCAG